ncbi:MAG TPA: hypothetical protein PKK56_00815 [archaeon]|nr:hypothetical protein [archaeon]HRT03392.1 hypothetical protein [Candidatus Diapherotrites archaeon]
MGKEKNNATVLIIVALVIGLLIGYLCSGALSENGKAMRSAKLVNIDASNTTTMLLAFNSDTSTLYKYNSETNIWEPITGVGILSDFLSNLSK